MRCGARKVKDVKEELELLLESKVNIVSGQCGICLKFVQTDEVPDENVKPEPVDRNKDISTSLTSTTRESENDTGQQEQTSGIVQTKHVDSVSNNETVDVNFDSVKVENNDKTSSTSNADVTCLKQNHSNRAKASLRAKPKKVSRYQSDNDSVDVFFNCDSDIDADENLSTGSTKLSKRQKDKNKLKKTKKDKTNKNKKDKVEKLKKDKVEKIKKDKVEKNKVTKKLTGEKKPKKAKKKLSEQEVVTEHELKLRRALDPRILSYVDLDTTIPATRSSILVCKECKMGFSCKVQKFIAHIRSHTGEDFKIPKPYVCPVCSLRILNFTVMERHMATHTTEKIHPCNWDGCTSAFTCKRYLRKHIRQKHEGRRYICHITEKRYKCSMCDYKSLRKDGLLRHYTKHTNMKPFKCSHCDKRFNDRSNRLTHERNIHGNRKDYICEICGYATYARSDLNKHQTIHTGEKPFACDRCEYRCNRRSNLTKHLKIHSGDKLYKCSVCNMTFHSMKTCKNHEKHHTDDLPGTITDKSQPTVPGIQSQSPDKRPCIAQPSDESYADHTPTPVSINPIHPPCTTQNQSESGISPCVTQSSESIQTYAVSRPTPVSVMNPMQPPVPNQNQSQSEEWVRAVELLSHLHQM